MTDGPHERDNARIGMGRNGRIGIRSDKKGIRSDKKDHILGRDHGRRGRILAAG